MIKEFAVAFGTGRFFRIIVQDGYGNLTKDIFLFHHVHLMNDKKCFFSNFNQPIKSTKTYPNADTYSNHNLVSSEKMHKI